ncbi:MAG TPA: hypothetical protein DG753_05510 [Clostridium sp.]|nr:hypothetical protein [Clostridium sp.]
MKTFLGICNLLIPIVMIVVGVISSREIPENINTFIGYRTKRSMKNIDTWKFANKYCGELWKKLGIEIFAISIICNVPGFIFEIEVYSIISLVLIVIQIAVIIFSIYLVERELKNKFDENGCCREKKK